MDDIPFYTVKHWQENWEELMDRVENGETLGVVNEDGNISELYHHYLIKISI